MKNHKISQIVFSVISILFFPAFVLAVSSQTFSSVYENEVIIKKSLQRSDIGLAALVSSTDSPVLNLNKFATKVSEKDFNNTKNAPEKVSILNSLSLGTNSVIVASVVVITLFAGLACMSYSLVFLLQRV